MKRSSLIIIAAVILAPIFGSAIGSPDGLWYAMLTKPDLAPPNWVFGPVWTTLYALLAVSTIWVMRDAKKAGRKQLAWVFGVNIGLNSLWTPVFFGWNQIGLALLIIVLILISTVYLVFRYGQVRELYGWMNVPYAVWVGFATSLNVEFLLLN